MRSDRKWPQYSAQRAEVTTKLCYGSRMNKWLIYAVGFLGAVVAAQILLVLGQDVLDIAPEPIVVGSLASAGILSLACAASTLAGPPK